MNPRTLRILDASCGQKNIHPIQYPLRMALSFIFSSNRFFSLQESDIDSRVTCFQMSLLFNCCYCQKRATICWHRKIKEFPLYQSITERPDTLPKPHEREFEWRLTWYARDGHARNLSDKFVKLSIVHIERHAENFVKLTKISLVWWRWKIKLVRICDISTVQWIFFFFFFLGN